MNKISIITATYNAARTIRDCLECVRSQTAEVEHILVDGMSKDGTLDIVQGYYGDLAKIVSEPDLGIYDAMNKGLKLATSEIIGILNADDFYPAKDTLAQVLNAFDNPQIGACYGDLLYVDGRNTHKIVRNWRSGSFIPEKFYWGWMPPHPTFFVRRAVYEKHGLFNLELGSAADYEIMLRFLLKHRVRAAYIPKVLVKMRTGGVSNSTVTNRLRANKMDRMAWCVNDLRPYPWTLTLKPLRKIGQWILKKPRGNE
ncbi:MAG: glycosyltransferase [Bacteroidetes bacterium]|nr:glycosyltransferase [Bacteroidota bacterium]